LPDNNLAKYNIELVIYDERGREKFCWDADGDTMEMRTVNFTMSQVWYGILEFNVPLDTV